MSDDDAQQQADVARATAVMKRLVDRIYAVSEARGETNFRIDQIVIIGVCAWTTEDGDEVEDCFSAAESRKHHVVTGILADTLAARFQRSNADT